MAGQQLEDVLARKESRREDTELAASELCLRVCHLDGPIYPLSIQALAFATTTSSHSSLKLSDQQNSAAFSSSKLEEFKSSSVVTPQVSSASSLFRCSQMLRGASKWSLSVKQLLPLMVLVFSFALQGESSSETVQLEAASADLSSFQSLQANKVAQPMLVKVEHLQTNSIDQRLHVGYPEKRALNEEDPQSVYQFAQQNDDKIAGDQGDDDEDDDDDNNNNQSSVNQSNSFAAAIVIAGEASTSRSDSLERQQQQQVAVELARRDPNAATFMDSNSSARTSGKCNHGKPADRSLGLEQTDDEEASVATAEASFGKLGRQLGRTDSREHVELVRMKRRTLVRWLDSGREGVERTRLAKLEGSRWAAAQRQQQPPDSLGLPSLVGDSRRSITRLHQSVASSRQLDEEVFARQTGRLTVDPSDISSSNTSKLENKPSTLIKQAEKQAEEDEEEPIRTIPVEAANVAAGSSSSPSTAKVSKANDSSLTASRLANKASVTSDSSSLSSGQLGEHQVSMLRSNQVPRLHQRDHHDKLAVATATAAAAAAADQIIWSHSADKLKLAKPELLEHLELESFWLQNDELFLTKESARSGGHLSSHWLAQLNESRQRRAVSSTAGSLQTIYFGGFFPWLTHEDQQNGAPSRRSKKQERNDRRFNSKQHSSAATTLQSVSSESSSILSVAGLMNANQEHQAGAVSFSKQAASEKANEGIKVKGQEVEKGLKQHDEESKRVQQQHSLVNKEQQAYGAHLPVSSINKLQNSEQNRYQLGRFILPAVRLALDHINKNSSVLGPYKLEIVPRDTQCNATISLKEFFDMVYEAPKKILLYGDACRVSTDPIAKASYFFDLIQISYADTDPIYTIENYPNFFRVVPSENALSLARIPFIRHFNWTRVGTIYQNLPRYSLPHSKLLTDLERYKIVIKQSVSLPGSVDGLHNRDLGDELRKLKDKDVRIILGNFDEEWGLLLFCEAFREKMTGRKYQWILTGMSENRLWQYYKSKGSSCTEQELLIAMDGYIVTDITPVTRSQQPTISGLMAHEYSNEYKKRASEMNISFEENKFYGYVYDGIWAIALALHRVDNQLKYYNSLAEAGRVQLAPEMKGLHSLLDFNYHKPIWVKLIRSALNRTKFHGVTGTVSFNKNERPGLISFSQFQAFRDMSEVIIGSYDALKEELDLKVGFPIFWRGTSPPIDYTIERVTPFRINRSLFVIVSILAIFGIVLAIIFLTINIKFRNQRYIKMSSPYLNNLIIIGCILTYTSVIILGLDSGLTSEYNFPYICNARAWVLMAGFTLAFGSMFSKTFRVHSIFTNIKLHKKVIKDYKLFMVVFILLTFDVCILIVWQYFDPFYRETNNGTSIQDLDNEDVIIVPEMEHCQSKRMTIFLSVIYIYKGLLMAFGCFLAWETRHVSIPALNDSKYIGLSVYNVVIMCVIGAGLSFVLRDQQDASFVIISIFIIFCSTTTLCLVFVPKLRMLIELKQNPRAGDHRVRATLKTFKKNYQEEALGGCRDVHGNLIGRGFGVNLNERIKILLEENVKQRSVLKEKTYELEALTYKYRKIQNMVQSGQYFQALQSTANTNVNYPIVLDPESTTRNLPINDQETRALTNDGVKLTKAQTLCPDNSNLKFCKSPLMSSTTQLTTTITTSSTNNATDMTTDYSSPKLASSVPASKLPIPSQARRNLVAFNDSGDKGDEKHVSSTTNYTQNLMRDYNGEQMNAAISKLKKQSSQVNKRPDKEQSEGRLHESTHTSSKSKDDLSLFSVFSYLFSAGNQSNQSKVRERRKCDYEVENSFLNWSKGPFCSLMIKNCQGSETRAKLLATQRSRAIAKARSPCLIGHSIEDVRSSCPSLISKFSDKRQVFFEAKQIASSRQMLRQMHYRNECSSSMAKKVVKKTKLPRTLSLIEYLGLSEFDLIARRHDRLVRRRLIRRHSGCCYRLASCMYCPDDIDLRQQHTRIPFESNISPFYADVPNSKELIQAGSRLSCSTCCSSILRSYDSQSNFQEDLASNRSSDSSGTPTSMLSYSSNQHLYHTHSQTFSHSSSTEEHDISLNMRHTKYHLPIISDQNYCRSHQHDSLSSDSASSSTYLNRLSKQSLGMINLSLCKSNTLSCPLSAKEAANTSAQPEASTSGIDKVNLHSTSKEALSDPEEEYNEGHEKFTIKCDVLESL